RNIFSPKIKSNVRKSCGGNICTAGMRLKSREPSTHYFSIINLTKCTPFLISLDQGKFGIRFGKLGPARMIFGTLNTNSNFCAEKTCPEGMSDKLERKPSSRKDKVRAVNHLGLDKFAIFLVPHHVFSIPTFLNFIHYRIWNEFAFQASLGFTHPLFTCFKRDINTFVRFQFP